MKAPRLCIWVAALSFLLTNSVVAQQTTAPAYIKADRSIIESQFGIDAAEFIFSDDLTKERQDFIVRSLQRIPAQGCPDDPSFTMIQVAPLQKNTAGFAWMERFDVDCHPKVRRTWIVVAQSDSTIRTQEILPGDTIADIKLQADVARGVTATASGRRPAGCQEIPKLMDTLVVDTPSMVPVKWLELWVYRACNHAVEVEVQFSVDPQGNVVWIATAR